MDEHAAVLDSVYCKFQFRQVSEKSGVFIVTILQSFENKNYYIFTKLG